MVSRVPLSAAMPPLPETHTPLEDGAEAGLTLVLMSAADRPEMETFLARHGLRAEGWRPRSSRLFVRGAARDLGAAFGLRWARTAEGHVLATGEASLPVEVHGRVRGLLGLDTRPRLRPHLKATAYAESAAPKGAGFTVPDFAARYRFPQGNGAGQRVGLLQLGGAVSDRDFAAYFAALGLPAPVLERVAVSGGDPSPAKQARWEATLDAEVLGALLPKATLVLYTAPNSADGLLDLIEEALKGDASQPSVLSMSWGAAESAWGALELELVSDALARAKDLGVTVLVSSGDEGSSDVLTDGKQHVNFPASCPWVLGVGGTQQTGGKEVVWNALAEKKGATGGGVSDYFDLPDWQKAAGVPASANDGGQRRAVPDVAAHAAEDGGYRIFIDGHWRVLGGTSAAAPLLAGLLVRINAARIATGAKPLGYLNPVLYGAAKAALMPITEGGNGAYAATPGYSACTGLGVPDGVALLKALS